MVIYMGSDVQYSCQFILQQNEGKHLYAKNHQGRGQGSEESNETDSLRRLTCSQRGRRGRRRTRRTGSSGRPRSGRHFERSKYRSYRDIEICSDLEGIGGRLCKEEEVGRIPAIIVHEGEVECQE